MKLSNDGLVRPICRKDDYTWNVLKHIWTFKWPFLSRSKKELKLGHRTVQYFSWKCLLCINWKSSDFQRKNVPERLSSGRTKIMVRYKKVPTGCRTLRSAKSSRLTQDCNTGFLDVFWDCHEQREMNHDTIVSVEWPFFECDCIFGTRLNVPRLRNVCFTSVFQWPLEWK